MTGDKAEYGTGTIADRRSSSVGDIDNDPTRVRLINQQQSNTNDDNKKQQNVVEDEAETATLGTGSYDDKLFKDEFDPVYLAKSKLLSDSIAEIGMGRYQWLLFIVCGFGWMADNV